MHLLQTEAAWVLCNIAACCSNHTQAVVQTGVVPILVTLLSSIHKEVKVMALWTLGNIAADCQASRDLILAHSVHSPIR